jgi:hypothetical protein
VAPEPFAPGRHTGTTWEARIKLNCLTPGAWPAWRLANNNPVNGGESSTR